MRKIAMVVLLIGTCNFGVAQVLLTTTRPMNLVGERSASASTVKLLKKAEKISLVDFNENFYTVVHEDDTLFLYYPFITDTDEIRKFKTARNEYHAKANALKKEAAREVQALKEADAFKLKVKQYSEKFGEQFAYKIANKEIAIGMTKEMVRASIGSPDKINSTRTATSTHEQWVYKNKYIYFDDGVLTTIQSGQ
jgi:hypothetical protein